jgi:hypothetical protein
VIFLFFYQGWFHALGALVGALLLDGNLYVFQRVIGASRPGRVEKPVAVTILKFYGLFALTALLAFLAVFLKVGNPMAFLGGLLTLVPALLLAVLWAGLEFLVSLRRVSGDGR